MKSKFALFTLIIIIYIYYKFNYYARFQPLAEHLHGNSLYIQRKQWQMLYRLYKQHSPYPAKLKLTKKVGAHSIYENGTFLFDQSSKHLYISQKSLRHMRSVHSSLVARLPIYPGGFKGCGIVMVSGGPYLQAGLLSIRMLRRTNSTIPVELWMIDQTEFNEVLCKGELADIAVACRVISIVTGDAAISEIKGYTSILRTIRGKRLAFYQIKSIAILLSSFEKVLFIDADNFPLYDPTVLFTSSPFIETGIVAWPDFWCSSVSAQFYNISSLQHQYFRNMSDPHHHKLAEANTVESGQIMWNKQTHWKALVLAVYYNIFGRDFYYPLLSLGGPGQGDKETFIMAARVLYDDYYFVSQPVTSIGHQNEKGNYKGVAMLQANPIYESPAQSFFLHSNGYKFNKNIISNIRKSFPSSPKRIWPKFLKNQTGFDVEYAIFQELKYLSCRSQLKIPNFCEEVKYHIFQVFEK